MPANVNRKIRAVDRKLSGISRKLGYLQTRVFFRPIGGSWEEVTIFDAVDQGSTPKNLRTGEEVFAHRYAVQVDRDWLESHINIDGAWAIAPDGNADNKLLCELENQTTRDSETHGTIDLRVSQPIAVQLPPPPPVIIPPVPL